MEISFINVTFPLQKENLCLVFRVLPISAGSQWLQFKITHMSKRHILGLCIWVPSNMFMEVGHYYQFHYIPSSLYTFLDLTSYHGSTLREQEKARTLTPLSYAPSLLSILFSFILEESSFISLSCLSGPCLQLFPSPQIVIYTQHFSGTDTDRKAARKHFKLEEKEMKNTFISYFNILPSLHDPSTTSLSNAPQRTFILRRSLLFLRK